MARWLGSDCPNFSGILIAKVERLDGSVSQWIVRPWGEAILAAINGPAKAAAGFGYQTTEFLICQDIGPWCRRRCAGLKMDDIFAPVRGEPANTVIELEILAAFKSIKILQVWKVGG